MFKKKCTPIITAIVTERRKFINKWGEDPEILTMPLKANRYLYSHGAIDGIVEMLDVDIQIGDKIEYSFHPRIEKGDNHALRKR